MLFNLEHDRGNRIEGYLIPDGFSEDASLLITTDDGNTISLPCNMARPQVVQHGRHATGMVGFLIDERIVPGLAEQRHISVRDAKTGLLVYRRQPADERVDLKIWRLEFRMQPMLKFDAFCGDFFQYSMPSAERFGQETAMQTFHLHGIPSIYISGRLYFRNYEEFLDKGFQVIADIPDPYYEMATRLFILQRLSKAPMRLFGERDRMILAPAADHLAEVDLKDDRAIKIALKRAPDKVRDALSSPITRQLVCTYPEQRVGRRDVAAAIGALSRFSIIGYGDDQTHFQQAVGELIGVPPMSVPVSPRHSVLDDLARRLRELPIAEQLLEEDLIFDHYVRQAVAQEI